MNLQDFPRISERIENDREGGNYKQIKIGYMMCTSSRILHKKKYSFCTRLQKKLFFILVKMSVIVSLLSLLSSSALFDFIVHHHNIIIMDVFPITFIRSTNLTSYMLHEIKNYSLIHHFIFFVRACRSTSLLKDCHFYLVVSLLPLCNLFSSIFIPFCNVADEIIIIVSFSIYMLYFSLCCLIDIKKRFLLLFVLLKKFHKKICIYTEQLCRGRGKCTWMQNYYGPFKTFRYAWCTQYKQHWFSSLLLKKLLYLLLFLLCTVQHLLSHNVFLVFMSKNRMWRRRA